MPSQNFGILPAGAFQADKRVRIYDTERDWALVKDIHARNLRWTITDTCLSKDQSLLLYATINPIVHMVSSSHTKALKEYSYPQSF